MKGVKRLTSSSYEIGDYVAIVPDDHGFDGKDLQNGRAEEALGAISDDERSKLMMTDEAPANFSAISQLPTFRSKSSGRDNLTPLHRRKYQFDGGVKLKANAQERI